MHVCKHANPCGRKNIQSREIDDTMELGEFTSRGEWREVYVSILIVDEYIHTQTQYSIVR